MAAKDYGIFCSITPYLAKYSARLNAKGIMSEDRREITEREMLMILQWFVESKTSKEKPILEILDQKGKPFITIERSYDQERTD